MSSNVPNTSVEELHNASKLHENNLVIELGIDRIVTWLGVYFIFILGILMKVEEIFGSRSLACFPENYTNAFTKSESELAPLNCWELSSTANYAKSCLPRNFSSVNQEDFANLDNVKHIVKLFPLLLVFQAFLTSLPTVWWHFNFGSRLLAHLKLIQFLLDKICEAINKINNVPYTGRPYDSDSVHFIGKMPFRDPGVELALVQIKKTCNRLISLTKDHPFDGEEFPQNVDSTIPTVKNLLETVKNLLKTIKNLLEKYIKTKVANKQECLKVQKIFCNIEKKINDLAWDHQEKYNSEELIKRSKESLAKIREGKTAFIETIALFLSSDLSLPETSISLKSVSKFKNILKKTELAKKIVSEKHFTNSARVSYPTFLEINTILQNISILASKIANLCEIEKGHVILSNCVRSLRHKKNVHEEKEMQDRHFLSLLCYENFASLYYVPYIHLVFRVYGLQLFEGIIDVEQQNMDEQSNETDIISQTKPTVEAALRSWCHPQNLSARKLVSNYRNKQVITIIIAFVGMLLFGGSFAAIQILVNSNSHNLHCALPHICLICSLLREIRLNIFVATAFCSYAVVFILLCHQVATFNKRLQTNDCHLFELLQDLSMDALNEAMNESFVENSSSQEFDTAELFRTLSIDTLNEDENENAAGNSSLQDLVADPRRNSTALKALEHSEKDTVNNAHKNQQASTSHTSLKLRDSTFQSVEKDCKIECFISQRAKSESDLTALSGHTLVRSQQLVVDYRDSKQNGTEVTSHYSDLV